MASASLSELTYGLHSARRLGYIDEAEYKRLDDLARMVAAPLHGLIRKRRATLVANTVVSIAALIFVGSTLLS